MKSVTMSSKSSSAALSKASKAQDESHMKILRDLSQIQCNRHCFDCNQRGPTYVDVTIGSFVCMTCSGLLRGLTPPHRVKSISMATFTPDEIELLKSRGNEYCRKVWLATHTSRDAHLTSETDPDRRAALKSHMSAKYEQKRYYVDPSKLTKSELSEIQSQTLRALSSSQSSISNSNSSASSASAMQKSPSLSSASSGSSLSLQQNAANPNSSGNQPSPILNNLRNGHIGHAPSASALNQQNRLVNSVTLPDIKPLAGLLGAVNLSTSTNSSNANPINFINNLSTSTSTSTSTSMDEKIINTNPQKDPWGGNVGGGGGGGDFGGPGFNANANANFANFDEAFTSTNGFGGNANFGQFGGDLFAQKANGISNGGGSSNSNGGFANFDSIQKPLLPMSNGNHNSNHNANSNGNPNPVMAQNGHNQNQQQIQPGNEDRYAALKDLDELFKHDTPTNVNSSSSATNGHQNGLPNSTSLPVNLSSAGGAATGGGGGSAWFSSSPNQPNPFSQVAASPPNGNGWNGVGVGVNGGVNGLNGANPHNPFFSSPSWQMNGGPGSGPQVQNGSGSGQGGMFGQGQGQGQASASQSQAINFQSSGSGGFGFGGSPNFSNFQNFPNSNSNQNGFPVSQGFQKQVFNPFSSNVAPAVNPHNPFL